MFGKGVKAQQTVLRVHPLYCKKLHDLLSYNKDQTFEVPLYIMATEFRTYRIRSPTNLCHLLTASRLLTAVRSDLLTASSL